MNWTQKFEKALDDLQRLGEDYAKKKSLSWHLQELCSSIKSSLILEALEGDPKLSQVKAEAVAKSSEKYITHLKGTAAAIEEELTAKARYERASAHHEALRSLISLDKKLDGQSG